MHLKLATFLQLGKIPVLIETLSSLPSSVQAACKPYLTASGKPAVGLTANEFVAIVGRYLQQCQEKPQYIVLDLDPTHVGATKDRLNELGLEVIYLPPRSHDLSPPDSHFFGVVKNTWRKLKWDQGVHEWEEATALFRECALQTNVSKHIEDYIMRLEACIRANGRRFQNELRAIKRERSQR